MPYLSDPDVVIHHGDALETLRELPDESVHCIATSPPFYALRDYGVDGQIGLEDTPEEWAARLVSVFREARRVLRDDGSLWLECVDSYCANTQGSPKPSASTKGHVHGWVPNSWGGGQATPLRHPTKPKDLLGQPFLLAFALRADGWYWRGCYPWHKPNAMPESAKDRCTTAHSYVLHFSRSARYFFDGDAISEPFSANTHARGRSIGVKQEEEQEGGTGRAVLVGTRGNPGRLSTLPSSVIATTRSGGHSAKPEAWLDYFEAVSPGPYLELFARRNRIGWDTWGNQSLEHVEMVA